MPILHRHVVPNVPAWTADNGKIVFNAGGISHRRPITITATTGGTVRLDRALADRAGISRDISWGGISTGFTAVEYGAGMMSREPYVDAAGDEYYSSGWEQAAWTSHRANLGSLPAMRDLDPRPESGAWRETGTFNVRLQTAFRMYLGLVWDSGLDKAFWYARLRQNSFRDEAEGEYFRAVVALFQRREWRGSANVYYDTYVAADPGYGDGCAFKSDEFFPDDPIRLGNGFRLRYVADYGADADDDRGLDMADAYIDVSAVPAQ